MPKLPRHETKLSATPASSGGVISGSTIVRITRSGFAPPASAASSSSCGNVRSPARSVRNTSGAYWTPSTRMIPPGEYSGLRLPSAGAMPEHLEQRARRPEHLQPRERHDLRRQHQRHHEAEDERVAAADIGERHESARRRRRARRRAPCRRTPSRGCAPSPSTSRCSTARGATASPDSAPPGIDAFEQRAARAAAPTGRATTPISPHSSA